MASDYTKRYLAGKKKTVEQPSSSLYELARQRAEAQLYNPEEGTVASDYTRRYLAGKKKQERKPSSLHEFARQQTEVRLPSHKSKSGVKFAVSPNRVNKLDVQDERTYQSKKRASFPERMKTAGSSSIADQMKAFEQERRLVRQYEREKRENKSAPTGENEKFDWERWEALAQKDGALTDAEMREAREAVKALRGSILYRLSPNWMSDEDRSAYEERMKLAAAIEQRTSVGPAVWEGMTSRLPGTRQAEEFGESRLSAARKANPYADWSYTGWTDHPSAYLAGQGAMDLAELGLLGRLGQGIAKGAPILSKLPTAAQTMAGSGLTFGAKGALDAAAGGEEAGEIAKAAGIGFASGAVGSAAGQVAGKLGTKLLFRTGTQNAVPAVILRDTLSGTAFAGADIGTRMTLDAEYRPTSEEAVKDLAVAGAFSALSSLVGTLFSAQEAKIRLDQDIQAMKRDYATIVSQADGQATSAVLDDLAARSAQVRNALRTTQYVGQQRTVDAVTEFLDELDDAVARARAASGKTSSPSVGPSLEALARAMAQEQIAGGKGETTGRMPPAPSKWPAGPGVSADTPAGRSESASALRSGAWLDPIAETLGESGGKAMRRFYDGSMDADRYAQEFVRTYTAALRGEDRPDRVELTTVQAEAAWIAGESDRKRSEGTPAMKRPLDSGNPGPYDEGKTAAPIGRQTGGDTYGRAEEALVGRNEAGGYDPGGAGGPVLRERGAAQTGDRGTDGKNASNPAGRPGQAGAGEAGREVTQTARSWQEDPAAFAARSTERGGVVRQMGSVSVAYRETEPARWSAHTRETVEAFREFGIEPHVVDFLERNSNGYTSRSEESVTSPEGEVYLIEGSSINGREVAAHEALHKGLREKTPEALAFRDAVIEADFFDATARKYITTIQTEYFDNRGRAFDPSKDMDKLLEEFAAYMSGFLGDGSAREQLGAAYADFDALERQWQAMKEAMGKKGQGRTELRGAREKKEDKGHGKAVLGEVSDEGAVLRDSGRTRDWANAPGKSAGGLLDEVPAQNVPEDEGRGNTVPDAGRGGNQAQRPAMRPDAAGNERGYGLGSGKRPDIQSSAGEVSQQKVAATESTITSEPQENQTDTTKEIARKEAQAVTEQPRGRNFVIGESLNLPRGEKARFKANVEAIKIIRTLMQEERYATAEEQIALSKYVGWGGLSSAFDEKNEKWAKEYKQLKGLLSDEEYKSARSSTLNAHYTDLGVIRAMYEGLRHLGFQGGRMLEPSAGVGHFLGGMPSDLSSKVKSWTAVELDSITGAIAKYLYPNSDVRVQGFEKTNIPDNYMDVAISNVPFGNYAIVDKAFPKSVTSAIHNYFFAKALDKVRPGGLVMFITSRYTMDSVNNDVRRYIMQRADLLGAVRLPDSAFKGNAGTEVVTDILVLKKRAPNTPYQGAEFERSTYRSIDGMYESVNTYFDDHPEMVLGTPSSEGSMYRSKSLTYKAKPGDLSKQIVSALNSIQGQMDYTKTKSQEEIRAEIRSSDKNGKNGSMLIKNGAIFKNNNGVLEAVELKEADAKRTTEILTIRDEARQLLNLQLDGAPEKEIKASREKLNADYDSFVKENGPLNRQKNQRLFKEDTDKPFILSLENYDKKTKKAEKAAIFTKNTVSPVKTITHVDTVEEGIIVSVNETGGVDVDRIAALTGETAENVTRKLLDSRLAFKNRDGMLETAEKYLSGNVRAKLRDAEALAEIDKDYTANVEELRKVIPKDIQPEEIKVRPGVTWIPDSVYSDFAAELLGTKNVEWRKAVTVQYNRAVSQYNVSLNDRWLKSSVENTQTWGTPDRSFVNILTAIMNNKNLTVKRKLEDGSHVVDAVATAAVKEKEEKILSEFQDWMWKDEARAKELSGLYNEMFNNLVTPTYNGDNLTVNGANPDKPLRPHQRNAVQRVISSGGNTLLAHKVGAGKTYEMAASAMKLRQLGIVKKPMFVVPKSLVAQWGNEFLDFFPAAKILVLGESDFSAKNRKVFANRIATGDYDAVILSQEQFKAVPMSEDNQEQFYQDQITALEIAIEDAVANLGRRDPSIKQMEKAKKSFEAKLRKLADTKKDEDNINFESLGVDSIFVDEAHSYKNLFYSTNMSNVSGLGNKEGSQKAFDLYMKVRYLQKLNGGRGIVFATATPVMNSMSEMYIMQKYLQEDMMEQRGLVSFDAWANQFGEVVTVLEMNPSGKGYRQKQSFSRFKNLAELQQMFRSFSDVITEIPGLKIPSMKEGKRIVVESEPSQFQMDYIDQLAKRADAVKGRKVDPKDDNMLKITSDGRKLSYTQRMVDPSLSYEPGNKVEKCVDNVLNIWKESRKNKGTQLIFCDLSTPKGGTSVDVGTDTVQEDTVVDRDEISIYDDIKGMLISRGVPAAEIAFIHEANTNEKKARLFEAVNNGEVRVLIGSTGKMGVGMNAQKRIVALHHLDAPWRPGDIEQREGRALRQGNMNDEVGIYVYVTKKTFDSRMWDNLQRKSTFIHQIMAGDITARDAEGDGDFALSAAEIKAISSGDPAILEQFEVSTEIAKLEALERAHAKEVRNAKISLDQAKKTIAQSSEFIEKVKKDISARQDTTGENFSIQIGKKTYAERKAAGEALVKELKKHLESDRTSESMYDVGRFAGFGLSVTNGGDVLLRGENIYRVRANMDSPSGTMQSMEAALKRMDRSLAEAQDRLSTSEASIGKLEKIIHSKFDRAQDLAELRQRNNELLAQLNPVEDTDIADVDEESDSFLEVDGVDRMAATVSEYPGQWTADRVGSTEKQPLPLSDIIRKIRHDFGISITTGHIRGSKTRGRYNRADQGIRTKIANDLPTVSHELGHHLDRLYGLTQNLKPGLRAELIDHLDQSMKDAYPKKKWVTEGLAEYVRRFLQNRETAAIDYPEFTQHFLSSMKNTDGPLLEQLADEINAYYSLDASTASSSIRFAEERGADFRTDVEKIKDMGDDIYQAWVDSNHAIKRFDKAAGSNVHLFATNAAYSDAMAGQILVGDLTDRNGQYVGPGLKTALHGIKLRDKQEYRAFGEYLVVRHGPERLQEGLRVFADDRKNSTTWMEHRQEELEAQYPAFKEAAERLYQFESDFLRTWGVETGLVSKKSADEWEERWKNYVPFNRAMNKQRAGAKKGYANQSSGIRKAVGSGLDIVHPVDNIIFNVTRMVNAGVRNNVMRELTSAAERSGGMADFLEKVPMPLRRTSYNATKLKGGLKQSIEESAMSREDKDAAFDIVENIDDILYQYSRGKAGGDVVTVMKGGKLEYWKINDPGLLESIGTLTPSKIGVVAEAYGTISRFMTSNLTGNNILWSIFSNGPRDFATLFTYSSEKNPLKLFGGILSGYGNHIKGQNADPLFKEYLAMGGGHTSAYTADRDLARRTRKRLNRRAVDWLNLIEDISFVSDAIEMGPRYAYYKILRQKGASPQEAFYGAMDVTTNFRRHGTRAREVNKFVPFFNVSIQSLDKLSRWIRVTDAKPGQRVKAVRSRTIAYIAANALLAALIYGINNRDEESEKNYEQLSNYTKNAYWAIPMGDGQFFTIPKPREIVVLSSFFERLAEYFHGENQHALDGFYDYAAENFLPTGASDLAKLDGWGFIGSLGLVGVGANMMANRDFMGRPIVSPSLQRLEPKDQYTNRTSAIAKAVGGAFSQSPQMIDYFFQQALGGWWKAQKALFPVDGSQRDVTLGIQGTYIRDNQYSTDLVNWLYDKADASAAASKSDPEDTGKALEAKWDSNMTTFYTRYNKLSKDKSETTATRATRQTVLDMILEYQKASDNGTKTAGQKAVEAVCSAAGTTEYLPSVMQSTIKDENKQSHTLSAAQYVEYQGEYLRLYWEAVEDALPRAGSQKEKEEILKNAKDLAGETARARALKRIGAAYDKDDLDHGGLSLGDEAVFEAAFDMLTGDKDDEGKTISGSKRDKVIETLEEMSWLTDAERDYLFSEKGYSDKSNPWAGLAPDEEKQIETEARNEAVGRILSGVYW